MTLYYLMAGVLVVLILVIAWSLHKRDEDRHSKIDLEDLLLGEDGRLSKAAAVMLGAFALTTWQMIYLTLSDKMTEGYLGIYVAAWIAPTVARLFKAEPAPTPPAE